MHYQYLLFTFSVFSLQFVTGRLTLEGRSTNTFDLELYENVLDQELCVQQLEYMSQNNTFLLMRFIDAGARLPSGIFTGTFIHLGNYFECLGINEEVPNMSIEGKYCLINVPLQQDIKLPFDLKQIKNLQNHQGLLNFEMLNENRSDPENPPSSFSLSLGICLPKACTSRDWVNNLLLNVSAVGFKFEEQYCRLPNDKPFVAADCVAIVVFSIIGILTILSTAYDVYQIFVLKKESKQVNTYYRMFSVFTNTRRLLTFAPNPNALVCLDGIRSISMMWVIMGHTFSSFAFNINIADLYEWITSAKGIWVTTAFFAVDTFFTIAGILLVYTTMGKMSEVQLLKHLHLFYLNRILRMSPLLAAAVLLKASLFHKLGDGPYWLGVAGNVERCRHFWWLTLLYVQNYANPYDVCLPHTWYLAIDIQLYIVSPIVLFWVLRGGRKSALIALLSSVLVVMAASTTWNVVMKLPASPISISGGSSNYFRDYYFNTLPRAAPFFIGMVYGYILYILRGQRFKVNFPTVSLCWILTLSIIALAFYTSYLIMSPDWDNRIGDYMFNSFMRAGWAIALGWIILACVKGYGGPVNWFLSLDIWKFLSRLSYAMYLFHYPIQTVVAGRTVTPTYFSAGSKAFEFLAFFTLSLIVAFVVTVVIDGPFSILIKNLMQRRQRSQTPQIRNNCLGEESQIKRTEM